MKKFIPKEKLGKKARKQLDSEQRTTWAFSPVTKKVESKKLYNRKRKAHEDAFPAGCVTYRNIRLHKNNSLLSPTSHLKKKSS